MAAQQETVSAATDKTSRTTPAASKAKAPPKKPEPVDLAALATKIAAATRLKDLTVELVQNGRCAVIVFDGRKLAYVVGSPAPSHSGTTSRSSTTAARTACGART